MPRSDQLVEVTYIDKFLIEVVCVVAVLHEYDELVIVLGILVQFDHVVVLKARVYDTFFPRKVDAELVHQL